MYNPQWIRRNVYACINKLKNLYCRIQGLTLVHNYVLGDISQFNQYIVIMLNLNAFGRMFPFILRNHNSTSILVSATLIIFLKFFFFITKICNANETLYSLLLNGPIVAEIRLDWIIYLFWVARLDWIIISMWCVL